MAFDVRAFRLQLRLNQREFSQLTGISQPSIANMELGKKPLTKIHEHFFISLNLLYKSGLWAGYVSEVEDFKAAAGLLEID